MRMRRENTKKDQQPVSDHTRTVLDSAIVHIVQAIGSKAGVLTFWDEQNHAPGQVSSYGLTPTLLNEIKPTIVKLVIQLRQHFEQAGQTTTTRAEEYLAIQTDLTTSQGALHLICLPIQANDRFIAGLCLLQPSALAQPLLGEAALLTPTEPGGEEHFIPGLDKEEESYQNQTGLVLDRGDLVARNARLVKSLVEENQRLEAIIEYSPDGILIIDSECNIIGFNPSFARLSGWTLEELRGQNCYEALKFTTNQGEAYGGMSCPIRLETFVNKPEAERRSEVVLMTKDGERRHIELTYSVILSTDGRILGGILGARDITARKEAEELQSTFLSVISHELQTPIAIIKGYAGLYADETTQLDPVKVREKMQIIQEESERLSKLVDNLLYASRLQAGGVELNRQPIDLTGLLRRVTQKMREVSKVHKVSLALPDPNLPAVLADYDKIEQVLVNLVENAIKYSPVGGPIIISAEPTSSEVIISVTDSGIGVPENERERIFDRFSRLDSRYVRQRKGAGLGLYICKAIVEAHGGHIWVEAAHQGKSGSSFNFSLPREEPAHLPVLFGKV
jgi:PAS domain S-box-containing protein